MDERHTSQAQDWITIRKDDRERLRSETDVTTWLDKVREAAIKDKSIQFTALFHRLTPNMLRRSFEAINPKAATGADGVKYSEYKKDLEENLKDLTDRLHRGAYRATPSRRKYIPKAEGSLRPLGIAALEDKIVQQAVAEILETIYETDFSEYSYGFRPGRSCHDALDELYISISNRKVSWILDADIKGFFDAIDHELLIRLLENRIKDPRILKIINKWLKSGVMEDGEWLESNVGSPQGAVISPLLANIYLHYVLDCWVYDYKLKARGEVHFVRYADDFVVGFQYKDDAIWFYELLKERLAEFKLMLHPDKTRLIEFGRFAAENRRRRGQGKPETFDFLGFTHSCSITMKDGKFKLLRTTIRKKWHNKLSSLRLELRKRINWKIERVGKWLRSVVTGFFNYYAVPDNGAILGRFVFLLGDSWMKTVRRRSHKAFMTWEKFKPILKRWLPSPTTVHPYPSQRYKRPIQLRSPVRYYVVLNIIPLMWSPRLC